MNSFLVPTRQKKRWCGGHIFRTLTVFILLFFPHPGGLSLLITTQEAIQQLPLLFASLLSHAHTQTQRSPTLSRSPLFFWDDWKSYLTVAQTWVRTKAGPFLEQTSWHRSGHFNALPHNSVTRSFNPPNPLKPRPPPDQNNTRMIRQNHTETHSKTYFALGPDRPAKHKSPLTLQSNSPPLQRYSPPPKAEMKLVNCEQYNLCFQCRNPPPPPTRLPDF